MECRKCIYGIIEKGFPDMCACVRFPKYINKRLDDNCGEFREQETNKTYLEKIGGK